jgi:hypothetical protein
MTSNVVSPRRVHTPCLRWLLSGRYGSHDATGCKKCGVQQHEEPRRGSNEKCDAAAVGVGVLPRPRSHLTITNTDTRDVGAHGVQKVTCMVHNGPSGCRQSRRSPSTIHILYKCGAREHQH